MGDPLGLAQRRGLRRLAAGESKHYGGSACDVLVSDALLQFWVGNELLKTVARAGSGQIRKKNASGTALRHH